jgi:hypothetical protein
MMRNLIIPRSRGISYIAVCLVCCLIRRGSLFRVTFYVFMANILNLGCIVGYDVAWCYRSPVFRRHIMLPSSRHRSLKLVLQHFEPCFVSQHDLRVTVNRGVLYSGCRWFRHCVTFIVLYVQFDLTVCDVWSVSLTCIVRVNFNQFEVIDVLFLQLEFHLGSHTCRRLCSLGHTHTHTHHKRLKMNAHTSACARALTLPTTLAPHHIISQNLSTSEWMFISYPIQLPDITVSRLSL